MSSDIQKEAFDLIPRIAKGDRKAFSRFYDLYAGLVFSFALRLVHIPSDAEDLLQEVFLQIWKQAGRYDKSRGNPEAWISTITKSRAIDKLRSARRKDEKKESFERHHSLGEEETAGRSSAASEARLIAGGVLSRLPEEQRKALELSYFEGLTHEEISKSLNVPLGTIKTRIRTGLQHLRELMGIKDAKS